MYGAPRKPLSPFILYMRKKAESVLKCVLGHATWTIWTSLTWCQPHSYLDTNGDIDIIDHQISNYSCLGSINIMFEWVLFYAACSSIGATAPRAGFTHCTHAATTAVSTMWLWSMLWMNVDITVYWCYFVGKWLSICIILKFMLFYLALCVG